MVEPESLILRLLQEMRGRFDRLDAKVDELGADLRSEMKSLRADVASDLMGLERRMGEQEKRAKEQISGLRRAVMEYHSVVVGHGVLISDLDQRVQRLEAAT